jgi:hypothetical protein
MASLKCNTSHWNGRRVGCLCGVPQKGWDSRNGKVQVAVMQATITK